MHNIFDSHCLNFATDKHFSIPIIFVRESGSFDHCFNFLLFYLQVVINYFRASIQETACRVFHLFCLFLHCSHLSSMRAQPVRIKDEDMSLRLPFFWVLIPSGPFVSEPLVVSFVRNFALFGFGPNSEVQQFFYMN